jgi:hypothetical protein
VTGLSPGSTADVSARTGVTGLSPRSAADVRRAGQRGPSSRSDDQSCDDTPRFSDQIAHLKLACALLAGWSVVLVTRGASVHPVAGRMVAKINSCGVPDNSDLQ